MSRSREHEQIQAAEELGNVFAFDYKPRDPGFVWLTAGRVVCETVDNL